MKGMSSIRSVTRLARCTNSSGGKAAATSSPPAVASSAGAHQKSCRQLHGVTAGMLGKPHGPVESLWHTTSMQPSFLQLFQCQQRSFYAKSSFSSLEYPLATEAPEITRTTATEAAAAARVAHKQQQQQSPSYTAAAVVVPMTHDDELDRFDDAARLDASEKERIRQAQKQYLPTATPTLTPIETTVPRHVPPNVPAQELAPPVTLSTTLPNGVKIVSQETYGQVTTVGVVSQVASRLELPHQHGVTNLLELLAFGSSEKYSGMQVTQLLQDWGGTRFCSTGREQSLHCIDLLRPNVSKAVDLLGQVLLHPVFDPEDLMDAKRALEFQALDMPPELVLGEALQSAAYGPDQQLGQAHLCAAMEDPTAIEAITQETVMDFWQAHFIDNPAGLVVAGAGIEHDFLVERAEATFGHLQQRQDDSDSNILQPVPSVYRGGSQVQRPFETQDGLVLVAVGLEVGGWHSHDLVATCVLQTLLGGGSSFSAGGPGKGMYSRLYRQVLNRYTWAESAEAFTAFHNESGLWGISGMTVPTKAPDMVQVLSEHLLRLAVEPVTDEELDRARNMLKCNVLTQLESRLVLFEDLGRQVLTYGYREDMQTTCAKIDAITQDDLMRVARRAVQTGPVLASVGPDLSHVPDVAQVARWFS